MLRKIFIITTCFPKPLHLDEPAAGLRLILDGLLQLDLIDQVLRYLFQDCLGMERQ